MAHADVEPGCHPHRVSASLAVAAEPMVLHAWPRAPALCPDRLLGGALGSSTRLVGCCTRSPDMALSDIARRILAAASKHPLRVAARPDKLSATACRSVQQPA